MAQLKVRKEIKTILKKTVPEHELHLISFSRKSIKDIDWKKEGKEFRHKGIMYDVVKYKQDSDSVFYYCINDQQETRLFSHLDDLINKQIDDDKSANGRMAKNLFKLFAPFKYISGEGFAFMAADNSKNGVFIYSMYCFPVVMEIPTPPPNQVI